jgi:hypothetical protein
VPRTLTPIGSDILHGPDCFVAPPPEGGRSRGACTNLRQHRRAIARLCRVPPPCRRLLCRRKPPHGRHGSDGLTEIGRGTPIHGLPPNTGCTPGRTATGGGGTSPRGPPAMTRRAPSRGPGTSAVNRKAVIIAACKTRAPLKRGRLPDTHPEKISRSAAGCTRPGLPHSRKESPTWRFVDGRDGTT